MIFDDALLHKITQAYKSDFEQIQWPREKYKWVAVKHFQDNWDIEAADFANMLQRSLAKTGNLLASANCFPARMIIEFAQAAPEIVRAMFRELFDENMDLWKRIQSFKDQSQLLLENHPRNARNHYQDENTICTYLWL